MENNIYSEQVVKGLKKLSQKYSMHILFHDFVKVCAVAIQNSFVEHDAIWEKREKDYITTMKKYSLEERLELARLSGILISAYAEGFSDVLGEIYMSCSLGNSNMGQFFTPYTVAKMMSMINLDGVNTNKTITLCEPTCGSGVMLISAADVLSEQKINYQKYLEVTAIDLDWTCVYMTYIQLSLFGIKAHVMQGDTLAEPVITDPNRIFITPAYHPAWSNIIDILQKKIA